MDILDLRPYETCSIRPPTENYSLTFRLARNCYWNKCAFCPVYKAGASFSKRPLSDVIDDIGRARMIDDYLFERGFGIPVYSEADLARARGLVEEIRRARWEAGILDDGDDESAAPQDDVDPRFRWFMKWFRQKADIGDSINNILTWRIGGSKTCFLGDADSLVLKPGFILDVISRSRRSFPSLERFTIYGRTRTAARTRTSRELKEYARAGLHRVHFGMESGSDEVLKLVSKGETAADHVRGCLKVKEAGLSCSVYVMPGLGGERLSDRHVHGTVSVINQCGPDYVRIRTLEIFPMTPLERMRENGEFIEASEEQAVREIRAMVANITAHTAIFSDSASNLLDISGEHPDDRDSMLERVDSYLAMDPREKLEFSLKSRLQSFYGQYGAISDEILDSLEPYIAGGSIRFAAMPDTDLQKSIRLIRSRLMP
ncbi:MAG TPA: radical SAM protein [Spirochaetota bacterium]|nr:radical SAM protein [Spirochaetota bacterium]